ncbi:hypothetical protein ABT247_08005 [Kitasatospora sp. NPDC001539]|uniref:helix-turn-helix domain-containing protein n=1 Tax=Kitasatospora sp. NPDC001539 TaxID=3154384 RepID=UPI0033324EC1
MAQHGQEPRPGQEPPAPSAAERFAGELRTLRLEAGQPSFRTMAKKAGSISHTTLYEAACGSRLPSWPTTRAFVQACGGDEEEWHRRWTAAVGGETPGESVLAEPPTAAPEPAPPPAPALGSREAARPWGPPGRPGLPGPPNPGGPPGTAGPSGPLEPPRPAAPNPDLRPRRLWTHALSLLLGLVLGVLGTLGLLAIRAPAAQPAVRGCPSTGPYAPDPQPTPAAEDPGAGTAPRSWIARTAGDQQAASSTGVTLPVRVAVAQGDALVVSMMLTGTCSGPVKVTDSHGDRFQLLGDVTDSLRHRVLLLAAFDASALTTADSIRADYPRAAEYHVSVDEFRGVTAVRAVTRASGDAGGTAFTTAANPAACVPGDLLVGTVGSNSGTAPEFGTGWTALPVLPPTSSRLVTAHRIATDTGHCVAAGRTTSQWATVLAVLR